MRSRDGNGHDLRVMSHNVHSPTVMATFIASRRHAVFSISVFPLEGEFGGLQKFVYYLFGQIGLKTDFNGK
jgi:hypothetical protein